MYGKSASDGKCLADTVFRYVNRFGFHIVEFLNSHHPDPNDPDMAEQIDEQFPDGLFRFEKVIKQR